jgi:hypothetical protein
MCHDCPHHREHEVGDEVVVFPEYGEKPHPCHNATHLNCVGSEMQLEKFHLNVCQKEDFETVRTIRVNSSRKGRVLINTKRQHD